MKYAQIQPLIQKGTTNLNKFISFELALRGIDSLVERTGKPYSTVARIVLEKCAGDWYKLDDVFTEAPNDGYLVGKRMSIISSLALSALEGIVANIQSNTDTVVDTVMVNSLIVNLKIATSNLFKAIDVYTGILKNIRTTKYINEIESQMDPSASRDKLISKIAEQGEMSSDVVSAISDSGLANDKFVVLIEFAIDRLIKADLIIDDKSLYSSYCDIVCSEAKDILDEYLYVLTRTDVIRVMEADVSVQAEVAESVADAISKTLSELSIINDYQLLFDKLSVNESKEFRFANIYSLNVEALEDSIVKDMITEELRESVKHPEVVRKVEEGKFND